MVATPTFTFIPRQPLPDPTPDAQPTPLALALAEDSLNSFDERQNYVTISVTTGGPSASDITAAQNNANKGGFPVAVAVPALVGGMAAAILGFGLWWWLSKRRSRKRRERWEAAQRRKRKRANSAANGRPSTSTSRNPSATNLRGMVEKDAPPVPMLPRQHTDYAEKQQYGQYANYGHDLSYNAYPQQPNIDQYEEPKSPTYSTGSSSSGSGTAYSTDTASSTTPLTEKPVASSKQSRSVARMAVAENAAARDNLDATVRYAPKKPSPLAVKAQETTSHEGPKWGDGPFRRQSQQAYQPQPLYGDQEMLAPPIDSAGGAGGGAGRQVVSGEWGVALGSPNHDPAMSFEEQQGQYANAHSGNNRYSNDPYIASAANNDRLPSGNYATDPYAGYHDPVANADGTKRSNRV